MSSISPAKINPNMDIQEGENTSGGASSRVHLDGQLVASDSQGSQGALVPADASVDDSNLWASCAFDCGPPRPRSQLTNTGNSRYPKWVCHPCNQYRRAIERESRKKGNEALYEAIQKLKANPEEWKARVRAGRVRTPDEPESTAGIHDQMARRALLMAFHEEVNQAMAIRDQASRVWMTQGQWLCHQKFVEGIPGIDLDNLEQRDKLWKDILANPDIERKGSGDNLMIKVALPDRVIGERTREVKKAIHKSKGVDSQDSLQDAMRALSSVGSSKAALTGSIWGQAANVFAANTAAGASSSSGSSGFVAPGQLQDIPPTSLLVDEEEWAPFGRSSGEQGQRGLRAVLSDPANPSRKKDTSRASRPAGTLVTGILKEAQEKAAVILKEVKTKYSLSRVNLGLQIKELAERHPTFVCQGASDKGTRYTDLVKTILGNLKEFTSWTASSCMENIQVIEALVVTLDKLATELAEDIVDVRTSIGDKKRQEGREQRAAAAIRDRVVKPYQQKGVPVNLGRWLYHSKFLGSTFEDILAEQDNRKPDTPKYWYEFVDIPADQDIDFNRCYFFKDTQGGIAVTLRELLRSFGGRLPQCMDSLGATLNSEQVMADPANRLAFQRLPAKGGNVDTLELARWTPASWRSRGWCPEALREFGAPWLMGQPAGATSTSPPWGRVISSRSTGAWSSCWRSHGHP